MTTNSANSSLLNVTLDDRYDLKAERVFLNGTQAIVRLLLMQQERDKRAGVHSAGFVSGYRGSPLGGLDQQLTRAKKHLKTHEITFSPGLNEDLAATACWGTQQAQLRGEGRYDGVFALWYGKGPGVDRTGDVFRHANMAGTAPLGGVVCLSGDDHTAESSTNAHQTEFNFVDTMIPILNPAGVQEILDYGLHAFALSRFAGVWVALKGVKDNVESTSSVDGRLDRVNIKLPDDFVMPKGGVHIRRFDNFLEQEARLHEYKRAAVLAYFRANNLDKLVYSGGKTPKIGIVTIGKSYLDVMQACDLLGINAARAEVLGVKILKLASPWPLDPIGMRSFTAGLDLCMVVEEKRSLIESQVREELYDAPYRPIVIGKKDEKGEWLFPVKGALDPNDIALALGERILNFHDDPAIRAQMQRIQNAQNVLQKVEDIAQRIPYFCAGCPHNTSTKLPQGARGYAGIGCHYMVGWMDRATDGFTQMGGEGANWIGEAPFSKRPHIFQNLGDGTYNHSGLLALRWAVATQTHITYKILFNDAVAMTGGQPHEGELRPDIIARQVRAEGVERIAIVSDEPDKYGAESTWPLGATFHHRSQLMAVQQELAAVEGVSVMIYDQTCAAEKRRRRKRGLYPDPDKRAFINSSVCEGCGDCGLASNCVAIQPLETQWGRKRQIDQSGCNKDFSCIDGLCPSFVSVSGAKIRKMAGKAKQFMLPPLVEPTRPDLDEKPWSAIITGIGGTGVVTIGALLGMAAHLSGRGCGMIDMAGLAQKGGAVSSHIRLAANPDSIHAIRVSAGMADLILGCDLVVSGSKKVLASVKPHETLFVGNMAEVFSGDFTQNADSVLPAEALKTAIRSQTGEDKTFFLAASTLAARLFGQSIAANTLLLGYAYQKGGIPLAADAIEKAIGINGEAVSMNLEAFRWGRALALDASLLSQILIQEDPSHHLPKTLEAIINQNKEFLAGYQDEAYAARYVDFIRKIKASLSTHSEEITRDFLISVAKSLFKLMAYKDEYEVARLFSGEAFKKELAEAFEGENLTLNYYLAPPLWAKKDPTTHRPIKTRYGAWMGRVLSLLQHFKHIRGRWYDPFSYVGEHKEARQRVGVYQARIEALLPHLSPKNAPIIVEIANLPLKIRGYGAVYTQNATKIDQQEAELLKKLEA